VAKRGHRLGALVEDGGKPEPTSGDGAGGVRPSAWSAVRSEASASWSIWDWSSGRASPDMSPSSELRAAPVALDCSVMTVACAPKDRLTETWNGPEDDEMWAIPR